MLEITKQLYEDLLSKLENTDRERDQERLLPGPCLDLIRGVIDQLKEKLKTWSFGNEEEEILFFKSALPSVLSLLIYYTEKFEMESVRFVRTPKWMLEYCELTYWRMENFFKENAEFFRYWLSGDTGLDAHYFLRSGFLNQGKKDLMSSLMDSGLGAFNSIRVATILAYRRLEQDIRNIFPHKEGTAATETEETKLEWTDSKTGLIELIYSLREQGAFNNGKADVKTITDYFENAFSVSLGNVSKYFQEILRRKTGRANYIDKLKDKLLGRIEEIEEGHVR